MSGPLASIYVDLRANSAAFKSDLTSAARALKSNSAQMNKALAVMERGFLKVQRSVGGMVKGMFTFRGALATITGAGGMGLLIKNSIDAADSIGKTADKLGVTTAALQEYRFAASQSGIETRTLDMALQRFTRRAAEAAQGKGELKDILKQYNIAVKDATGRTRDSNAVLNDLADVLQKTQSPAERLRIAFKAFDSEGAALVNMLRNGSAGLEQFRQQAQSTGVVIEDRLIRDAETASDKMDQFGKQLKAAFSRSILENVESLTSAVESLAGALGKIAKHAGLRSIQGTFTQGASLAAKGLLDWQKFIHAGFAERQKMVDDILNKMNQIDTHEQFRLGKSSRGAPIGTQFTPPDSGGGKPDTKALKSYIADAKRIQKDFWQSQAAERYEVQSRMYDGLIEKEKEYIKAGEEIGKDMWLVKAEDMKTMTAAAEEAGSAVKDTFVETFDSASYALTGFLTDGEFSFKKFADSIISDLARIGIQKGIASIGESLFSGLFSAKGNVFDTSGVKAFARGGIVSQPTIFPFAGGTGIMGEAGPEAIIPLHRDASGELGIKASGGDGGEKTVNYNIHIIANDAQSFSEMTRRNPEAIVGPVRRAIQGGDRGLIGLLREVT